MTLGIWIILSCAVIWVAVESVFCPMHHHKFGADFVPYIPGHALWHVGVSYGVSLMLIWIITMDSILEKADYFGFKLVEERIIKCPGNCTCSGYCNRVLNVIFPVLSNHRHRGRSASWSSSVELEMTMALKCADDEELSASPVRQKKNG